MNSTPASPVDLSVGANAISIKVTASDSSTKTYTVTVTWAAPPAPDIAVAQSAALTDGAGSVDFGTVTLGSSSSALTFTITNPGTADLTRLAFATADGANPGDFTVSALSGTTVPASGGSVTFTVSFTPGASGARSAGIHITSNVAGAKNPFDIVLGGTGVAGNSPPVAGADTVTRPDTSRVAKVLKSDLLGNDTDADLDTLTITAVGSALPAGATVEFVGNFVVYTAPSTTAGHGSFTYTLSDGAGGHTFTGTGTVTETTSGGGWRVWVRGLEAVTQGHPLRCAAYNLGLVARKCYDLGKPRSGVRRRAGLSALTALVEAGITVGVAPTPPPSHATGWLVALLLAALTDQILSRIQQTTRF